jgi:RNA polymerase sigma-70 factor (ECF subfamily)
MKNNDMRLQLIQLGNGAHALATQMLGNADDAADAVHDVFAKVLKKPTAYNANNGPLKPWFLCVLRNHCIDLIRRRHPGNVEIDTLIEPGPGPQHLLENSQRDQELQNALARLPVGQRQMIVLRDYLDLRYAEIAQIENIALGTVMSRLHRARLALKEELGNHG